MMMQVPILSHGQESCYTSFQLPWPKECDGAIDNIVFIIWYHHWWQWMKSHNACHFDHLDLKNAMVPLMMPFAWHVSGVTWSKKSSSISFCYLDLTNGMVQLMTLLASCDSDWPQNQWHCMGKKVSGTSFCVTCLNQCSGAIDDAIGIT